MSIAIAVPPRQEQDNIVKIMARSIKGLDSAKRDARLQITLLQEYHNCLISDVVTGKIDVQEAAARLSSSTSFPSDRDIEIPHDTPKAKYTARFEQGSHNVGTSSR